MNNFLLFLMDDWLDDFMHVLLMDNWLMEFMNNRLMYFINDLFVMFYNDILMMFMDYILMLFLDNRSLFMSLNNRFVLVLDNLDSCRNFLNFNWFSVLNNHSFFLQSVDNWFVYSLLAQTRVISLIA